MQSQGVPLRVRLEELKLVILAVEDQDLFAGLPNFQEAAHGQVHQGGADVRGEHLVLEQRAGFGGSESVGRGVHGGHGDARIGRAAPQEPDRKHDEQRPNRNEHAGIRAQEPESLGKAARCFEDAIGNVHVDGQTAAGIERPGGPEDRAGSGSGRRRVPALRAELAGKSLGAQAAGAGRKTDGGRGAIDLHRPVVARDVPVELRIALEEARGVGDRV